MVEPSISKTTVLVAFGKTGAGKSALGNKLLQLESSEQFKVSDSIISETFCAASQTKEWRYDPTLHVKFVDTPGFGDNRTAVTRQDLLTNTFKFLKELKAGFNVGILCVNATQTRIEGHELDDLVALGRLLGNDLFDNSIIALTQGNKLSKDERESKIQECKTNLPKLLSARKITRKMPILDAGWDRFDDFTKELGEVMKEAPRFQSKTLEKVDLDDPKAVEKWLENPIVTQYIEDRVSIVRKECEAELEDLKKASYASKNDLANLEALIKDLSKPAPIIIRQETPPPLCSIF